MSEPMKINMLGRDITVTREAMLSDGYCLSTVKHAERLASGPEMYSVTSTSPDGPQDSGGAIWLRGHIPFCYQCKVANEVKVRTTDYIRRHFPTRLEEWHQARMPQGLLGQVASALMKTDRRFMGIAIGFMNYNKMPLHQRAIFDRDRMVEGMLDNASAELAEALRKARVVMVETDVLFEAWQLLGSGPLYDKGRLVSDFKKKKIKAPFPATYIAFSEGINQHLINQFFDNMPDDIFHAGNTKGVLLYPRGEERDGVIEFSFAGSDDQPNKIEDTSSTEPRLFLWAALLRAMQDKVFVTNIAPEFEKERDAYLSSPPRTGWPARRPPEPFYAVRVNPNSSFRDPARVYGKRHINWTHRWEVAGHWRTYRDGKRVWISSYVKGPDDKPLIPSVRVYGDKVASQLKVVVGKSVLGRFMAWVRSFRGGGR